MLFEVADAGLANDRNYQGTGVRYGLHPLLLIVNLSQRRVEVDDMLSGLGAALSTIARLEAGSEDPSDS